MDLCPPLCPMLAVQGVSIMVVAPHGGFSIFTQVLRCDWIDCRGTPPSTLHL